jgi:hypothetical protein
LLTIGISFFKTTEDFEAVMLVPATAVLVIVPLNDFRVKGKADALLAAKVIAPAAMAHIRILVGFMIFVVRLIRLYTCFTSNEKQLMSHAGWLAGLVDWGDVNNMGTLTQKLIE